MAVANVFTLRQSTKVDFVATAVAFSRAFRPTASHAYRAITLATAISRASRACGPDRD